MADIDEIMLYTEEKMEKNIQAFTDELKTIRTGRASLSVLDHIKVDVYDSLMPINQLANLSVPESRTILIEPWDKATMTGIEKAILKSDLNITPSNDGKVIRLNFPPLTEERRQDFVKLARQKAENCKVSVRNSRRESNEELKVLEKEGHISKDDIKHAHDEIQKITDQYVEKISQIVQHKEKEIMEI